MHTIAGTHIRAPSLFPLLIPCPCGGAIVLRSRIVMHHCIMPQRRCISKRRSPLQLLFSPCSFATSRSNEEMCSTVVCLPLRPRSLCNISTDRVGAGQHDILDLIADGLWMRDTLEPCSSPRNPQIASGKCTQVVLFMYSLLCYLRTSSDAEYYRL